MKRAYSTIEIKAVSDTGGRRKFSGVASTPSTDRMGDQVDPMGMTIKTPLPFLWQHDSGDPIGWVTSAKATKAGINVECEIASISEPGPLQQRLDTAWQMLKAGLVRGLSIGFNSLEAARIEGTYGLHFLKTELLELSAVTIPANSDCSITTIKSIDSALLAATGRKQGVGDRPSPGDTGTKQAASGRFFSARSKGNQVKTIKELRELRATKAARLQELVEIFKAEGYEENEDETSEFDALSLEVKGLDQDIRIAGFHATQAKASTAVDGSSQENGSRSRAGLSFVKTQDPDDKFKGQGFVRKLLAQAASYHARKNGNNLSAGEFAQKRWGNSNPQLVSLIKANEVAGGGTGSGEWGAELVGIDNRYTGDFVEFLYAMTVFDRLGLRPAPKNVSVKGQDGAATGYWTGESKGIPVSKPDFSTTDLTLLKAAGIVVASKELMADSDPAAEMLIRDSLREAINQRIDTTFLSTTAASAGVSPAGILNGVSPLHTTGTDEAAVRTMIKMLYSQFISDKNSSDLKLVMSPGMAKAVGLIVNALGQTSFPGLGTQGGTLLGDVVITGDNVDPSTVLLIKPRDIWVIDGGIEVSMSDSAMIEQNSAPLGATDTPVAASVTLTSMFQEDSVAIKVTRRLNYKKRRANAVTWVDDADFDGIAS